MGRLQLGEEAVEELRPGGSTWARKPGASGLPETVGGGLPQAGDRSSRLSTAGPSPRSADAVTCVCRDPRWATSVEASSF